MVALSILTIGLIGIATLLVRSFFLSHVTADELTATYLASEGVELTKNIVDHDGYDGNGWGYSFSQGNGGDYEFDYAIGTTGPYVLPAYAGTPLKYDAATGRYNYETGTATPFTRLIRVKVAQNEITVNSIVDWTTGSITNQSVNVEDHFYNWRT